MPKNKGKGGKNRKRCVIHIEAVFNVKGAKMILKETRGNLFLRKTDKSMHQSQKCLGMDG